MAMSTTRETMHVSCRTDPLYGNVDGLQRLQALGHEEVGELELQGRHAVRILQDPLLVGVRSVVIRDSAGEQQRDAYKNYFIILTRIVYTIMTMVIVSHCRMF